MHGWQVERSFDAYNYLAMIFIIMVYYLPGSRLVTGFFPLADHLCEMVS